MRSLKRAQRRSLWKTTLWTLSYGASSVTVHIPMQPAMITSSWTTWRRWRPYLGCWVELSKVRRILSFPFTHRLVRVIFSASWCMSSWWSFPLSVFPLDNLWGDYGPVGTFIEKKSQPSVQVQETPTTTNTNEHYVINDITTYFTLLVGIYFPSVTGR